MRCLAVDPSAVQRRILAQVLTAAGWSEVALAADAGEALELLARAGADPFHLLLTEWDLPGRSGPDLIREIRAAGSWNGLPVLVIASRGARADVLAAREAGADAYLLKPVSPEGLVARVRALVPEAEVAQGPGDAAAAEAPEAAGAPGDEAVPEHAPASASDDAAAGDGDAAPEGGDETLKAA